MSYRLALGCIAAAGIWGVAPAAGAADAPMPRSCAASGDCVEIVWLGNTNWCFKYRGGAVLMDANLGPHGLRALEVAGCGKVDAILVGHDHPDHSRSSRSLARQLRAPVIGAERLATHGFEARSGRQFTLGTPPWLKVTALAVEHSGEVPRRMGFAGGPDPYGYALEFPVRDARGRAVTFFWTDTTTTVGLRVNPIDGLDYAALTREVFDRIERPVTLWFTFHAINRKVFRDFDSVLGQRFVLAHHLGPPDPDLRNVFDRQSDPELLGLANSAAESGSTFIPLGDFFSTYEVRPDSVVPVDRGFAQRFRDHRSPRP